MTAEHDRGDDDAAETTAATTAPDDDAERGTTTVIAVFVNPRSRANRRNPRIAAEFQAIVGDRGRVFAPKTLDELDAIGGRRWRAAPPAVIAVHGGDGTLHKTVTALRPRVRRPRRCRRSRCCAAGR